MFKVVRTAGFALIVTALLVTNLLTAALTLAVPLLFSVLSAALEFVHVPAVRNRYEAQISDLNTKISNQEKRIADLADTVDSQKTKISGLEAEKRVLAQEVDGQKTRISDLEGAVQERDTRISGLESSNSSLSSERDDLAVKNGNLTEDNASLRAERSQLQRSRKGIMVEAGTLRQGASHQAGEVQRITRTIQSRAATNAARNIGSMPFEAVPWLGIGTIVAVTGLEIKDACDTMDEMAELRAHFDLEAIEGSEESYYCADAVPSISQVRDTVWKIVWGELDSLKACIDLSDRADSDSRANCMKLAQEERRAERGSGLPARNSLSKIIFGELGPEDRCVELSDKADSDARLKCRQKIQ